MTIILGVYACLLSFISLFVLFQFIHWFNYHKAPKTSQPKAPENWPIVTVQLPLYNEKFVVDRLLNAVVELDYPGHLLEVQILDDSTDETTQLVQDFLTNYSGKVSLQHIRRKERLGYKAGALQYGLQSCKGTFIAIFDADFVPNSDYLKRVIPQFISEKIGVVQTRWGHINRSVSLLTEMQAFGLDAHFTIEQKGRNSAGLYINFNGTAGVWRKSCIEDAGGWSFDTLTEDLDLSYRAQMKGWKFVYDEDCKVPAELPSNINALKGQQFRWTKGAAECFRKITPKLLFGKSTIWQKINGLIHLSNSFLFLAILGCAFLSIPSVYIKVNYPEYNVFFNWAGVFVSSLFLLAVVYGAAYYQTTGKLKGFWWRFPLFLSVSMGLSLHNAIAVIEGYIGKKSPFVRTPKSGEVHRVEGGSYFSASLTPMVVVELFLSFVFMGMVGYGIYHLEFGLLPFHLMLSVGFFYVASSTFALEKTNLKNAFS